MENYFNEYAVVRSRHLKVEAIVSGDSKPSLPSHFFTD